MSAHNIPFKTLTDIPELREKRVIVRASLNVPLAGDGVRDAFRITSACKTISMLSAHGARVVVLAHIGREQNETLRPVYEYMKNLIPTLSFVSQVVGDEVEEALGNLKDGDVLLLENVRCDGREEENDTEFAHTLASYGELYINDAFADSHRAHASIVGISQHLPSYAGPTFVKEYEALSRAHTPGHPALFILGGAKFETKMPLVERFLKSYDRIFIGGALANDMFKAKGYEVGTSMVSDIDLSSSPLLGDERIIIPEDVVVSGPSGKVTKSADAVLPEEKILDAGEATIRSLAPLVRDAKFILWNGPLGNYEAGYGEATDDLARLVADAAGASILGGGDTVAAVEKLNLNEKFDFISTAGGAMLVFLETGTLPGIEALKNTTN